MFASIQKIFTPPIFPGNAEDTYLARVINSVLLFVTAFLLGGMGLVLYIGVVRGTLDQAAILQGLLIITLGFVPVLFSWILLLRKRLTIAGIILTAAVGLVVLLLTYRTGGIAGPVIFTDSFALVVAALVFRRRGVAFIAVAVLVVASAGLLVITASAATRLPPAPPFNFFVVNVFILVSLGMLIDFSTRNLYGTLKRTVADEKELEVKNKMLLSITQDLETIVDQRTAELRQASVQLEKRSSQFTAIADVARSIASIQDLDVLLPEIARVVSRRFDFYHTGIFLLDSREEYAVLRAASSEGGQRMLARNHRLRVGAQGIVGYVAKAGNPRIAADVGKDAVFFDNPDLPETHSEMALPLKISERMIGVLDVQSDERAAFTGDDVEVLTALANQVAIAIENARLFSQTRQALAELERSTRKSTRIDWERFSSQRQTVGYRLTGHAAQPLQSPVESQEMRQTAETGETQTSPASLAVPIKLRGQTIAVLGLETHSEGRAWSQDELQVLQVAADRVGLALENARLLQDTTDRAERERTVADISNKIRATNDPHIMIETAMRELQLALGASQINLVSGDGVDTAQQTES